VRKYNIGVYPNAQYALLAHNTPMDKQHTLRSEAQAYKALAETRSTVRVGKHFATPAPKRIVKSKPSILARIFKKG
jgi:hypothetical protein